MSGACPELGKDLAEFNSQTTRSIPIALAVDRSWRQGCPLRRVFFCLILIALTPLALLAQSGRQQPQPKKTPTPSQPERPRRAKTPANAVPAAILSDLPPAPAASDPPAQDVSKAANAAEEDVVRINSNLVVLPASVLDGQGRAVTDLQLADFQLLVDGQPRPLSDLSRSETPVLLAVLFDNSGSLTVARRFQLQAAISFFRRVMRPIDQAAIFSVSTFPVLEHPLTSHTEDLVRTIEAFGKPEGGTALFDAIAQAAIYLKPHAGRKVIVIVSDGVDTVSQLDFDTTLRHVYMADSQIFVVQTGLSRNANLRQLAAERRMQEFSAQTGGSVYLANRTEDLDTAFTQIAADLAQQYILSYYPADERRNGQFCVIRLLVRTRPGLSVRARKGYFVPKA